ncbi:dihydrolipoyllysine-residue succinyltransferase component of 2-oxoglutarate dehydrogenase complex 2 mitochondrial [Phtheirospermum japonicum]|uniref:dihydrolipoyllysine-residue succinyltransferase n=1 Tax=Phtheirospermum japonicum TaxID=374723 RepID=A0A830C8N6_9LAMI|nr:dihydrolipoyllysine-residue succinyltransferase component of 2-oxoglutarate dehydrogenase complex 2 mitochondrial [Phtheirospermum japonicum]
MLGVLRRKAASSVYGKSLYKLKPAVSIPRACSSVQEEIIHHTTGCGNIRTLCNVPLAGHTMSLTAKRKFVHHFQHDFNVQICCRPFSSSSEGDIFEAVVPFMGESISDGTLATFLKKPGDRVEVDEPIAQVETDKVTIDVTSPEAGVIQEFVAKEGDTVEPGTKVAIISKSGEGSTHVAPSDEKPSEKAPPTEAKEKPVPKKVETTTPVVEKPKGTRLPTATEPQLPPKERERRVPMTRLRKRVATRLKDSQNTFALLTTFNEVDMTNLMKLRSDYKDAFVEKHGVKLGLMSGFVKAAISALQKQPIVNAVIDGDDIIYRDYVDISIAGLVVPVLRNAESMNFAEVEKEINNLAKKANDGTISIDEMAGGTFTISNGGVYGSLLSTPIINPPQSAILGMHSIVNRPMVVGGNIVPRPMMYIALTYDHRLIDGREAVFFLRRIKDVVEDPRRLLLDAGFPDLAIQYVFGQQVTRLEVGVDELWFRVGDQFIWFLKYEYALLTGLGFGPMDSYSNVSGIFADSLNDQVKIANILFVYAILFGIDRRTRMYSSVLSEQLERVDKFFYHLYVYSHVFMVYIFVNALGMHERLEPTAEELIDYPCVAPADSSAVSSVTARRRGARLVSCTGDSDALPADARDAATMVDDNVPPILVDSPQCSPFDTHHRTPECSPQ